MLKSLFHCLLFVIITVIIFPLKSFGELPEGRWVHLERQAPQHDITAIFPGDNEKIWVSTKYTLHAFDGTYWKKYSYADQSLRDHTQFFRDPRGRFYSADGGELIVLEDGSITRYDDEEIRDPVVAAYGANDTVYLGSYNIISGGVYVFNGSSIKKVRGGRVKSLAVDGQKRIWATILDTDAESLGLMVLEGDEWIDMTAHITSLLPAKTDELIVQAAPDGSIWVSNLGKYGVLRDDEWTLHDSGSGPVFLSFDSSGGVWGYRSKTVYLLNESGNWEVSRTNEASLSNKQHFFAGDLDGTLWTFDSYHVYTYEDSEWTVVENNLDLASDKITCMAYTDDGKLMCGHGIRGIKVSEREDSGISVWDGGSWYNFKTAQNTFLYNVYIMKRSPDDEIVVHTDHGLKVFDGTYWSDVDSLESLDVADVAWDESGRLWVASYTGLVEYNYPQIDVKVNPEWLYPFKVFYNLHFDPEDGELIMQTNYGAIVSFDEDREENWLSHGSTSTSSRDIALDEEGVLWSARKNNLSWWKGQDGWQDVAELYDGRMVDVDDVGRIWASGFGTTGYYEDDAWHIIPELLPYASDRFINDGEGRYFINAFDIDNAEPPDRDNYYGLFVFIPGPASVSGESDPKQFIAMENFPNPFNSSTIITFSLPDQGTATVTIYNMNGQRVKTLASTWFPAGKNSVAWDSTSDSGLECSSGMYFYRVTADDTDKAGKMLLLR